MFVMRHAKYKKFYAQKEINYDQQRVYRNTSVIPPFLIELMGRKSKALLLFKNRWTTIY